MVKNNENPYCWQGPGASKLFDSELGNWKSSKLTKRYIYVLKYISENSSIEFKNNQEFKSGICSYLDENHIDRPQKPTPTHFYTPYQFVGFIEKNNLQGRSFELSISKSGKEFLESLENGDIYNARDIYLNQLFDSKFPNDATESVKLNLYPIKIMFKMLYEKEIIPNIMFLTDIQFIKSYSDICDCLKLFNDKYLLKIKEIEKLKKIDKVQYKRLSQNFAKDKWNSYINGGLAKLGVFDEYYFFKKNCIKFTQFGRDFVKNKKIDEINYKMMFI